MKQIVIYNYQYNVIKETSISRQILLQSIKTDTRIDNPSILSARHNLSILLVTYQFKFFLSRCVFINQIQKICRFPFKFYFLQTIV